MAGRKLNFGKISLWIENGKRRFTGADSLQAAEHYAREFISTVEEWLRAEDRHEEEITPPPLTDAQRKTAKRLAKKLRISNEMAEQAVREIWEL